MSHLAETLLFMGGRPEFDFASVSRGDMMSWVVLETDFVPDVTESLTTTTLLDGLLQPDDKAIWREFDARYRPIIVGFALRFGLSIEDAADVAQDTLASFLKEYRAGKYEPQRGRLRSWIIGILKHRVADWRRAQARRRGWRGESALIDLAEDDRLEEVWDSERRAALLRQALCELREKTRLSEKSLRAFEGYVVQQRSVEEVAAELGLTPHDVYMVKNRVAERLREILNRLEALFDDR